MSKSYLHEAFQAMRDLEEDVFNITDKGIAELKDFRDADDQIDEISIIDPEFIEDDVEVEEPEYDGKVILDCCACHEKLFKAPEEVILTDDETKANIEEECPVCHSTNGYKVIGVVAPYSSDDAVDVTVDGEEDPDLDIEIEDDEDSETDREIEDDEPLTEAKGKLSREEVIRRLRNVGVDIDEEHLNEARVPMSRIHRRIKKKSNVDESFDKVEIETGTDKIKIESEPKDTEISSEETIQPVPDDMKADIEAQSSTDEEDIDIDEMDTDTFDDLGESYLKEVYANVKSYKTTSVEATNEGMKLDGVITFNSGNKKNTSFIFESHTSTKSGKLKFLGSNQQILEGKKIFTLAGTLNKKNLICESLTYNYRTIGNNGKPTRLYGTVKRSK